MDATLREPLFLRPLVDDVVDESAVGASGTSPATLHLLLPRTGGEMKLHHDASNRKVDGYVANLGAEEHEGTRRGRGEHADDFVTHLS